ncbi:MAG: restriction endonuclease subunit S [Bacteroides uniformis]
MSSYYEKFLATGEVKCIDEEIPFEIPQGWEWSRMGSIGDWGAGATPAKGNTSYYGGNILWLRTGELNNSIVNDTEIKITDKALKECSLRLNKAFIFINGNNLFDGQILIKPDTKTVSKEEAVKHSRLLNESTVLVSINGTIGNIAFYSGENVIFLGKSACYFNLLNGIERKYIKIVLQTDYFLEYTKRVATGSTIKNVPLSGMRNVLIPIPPKDEQQVIIDKLSSLKLLIEKIQY